MQRESHVQRVHGRPQLRLVQQRFAMHFRGLLRPPRRRVWVSELALAQHLELRRNERSVHDERDMQFVCGGGGVRLVPQSQQLSWREQHGTHQRRVPCEFMELHREQLPRDRSVHGEHDMHRVRRRERLRLVPQSEHVLLGHGVGSNRRRVRSGRLGVYRLGVHAPGSMRVEFVVHGVRRGIGLRLLPKRAALHLGNVLRSARQRLQLLGLDLDGIVALHEQRSMRNEHELRNVLGRRRVRLVHRPRRVRVGLLHGPHGRKLHIDKLGLDVRSLPVTICASGS